MGGLQGSGGDDRSHLHLCRLVDGHAGFREVALEFLAEGLARGCRVRYIAEGDLDALLADVAPLERRAPQRPPRSVEVSALAGDYSDPTACVDPEAQVATFAGELRTALDDGFAGLRVAADVTALVRTPAQLDAFARYEHRADRLMSAMPQLSGLCGYRRSELGDDVVAQLACLHPDGDPGDAPFRLHATAGADVAVRGELDITTVDLFATTLRRAGLHGASDEVVVDATGLDFADHRNLLVLEEQARRHDRSVVLRSGRRYLDRLVTALELTRVRVERVA
jgi:hypothetical protein